jgi:hypothetical protein
VLLHNIAQFFLCYQNKKLICSRYLMLLHNNPYKINPCFHILLLLYHLLFY